MDRPDVSAALLRATGDDFARNLQTRLIALANATDDEAYASRLRLVANGERPLRALLQDPKWCEAFGAQMRRLADPPGLDREQRRTIDETAEQLQQRMARPSEDEIASDVADVMRRAILTNQAVREDELGGWSYVHDSSDGPDGQTDSGR